MSKFEDAGGNCGKWLSFDDGVLEALQLLDGLLQRVVLGMELFEQASTCGGVARSRQQRFAGVLPVCRLEGLIAWRYHAHFLVLPLPNP